MPEEQTDIADAPIPAPPVDEGASPSLEEVIADYTPPEPQEEVAEAADPITHESVQSDKAPEESLPDSSLISDRLQKSANETSEAQIRQTQAQELESDRDELRQLRLLRRGEAPAPEPEPTQADTQARQADAQDDRIKSLEARLEASEETARVNRDRAQVVEDEKAVVDWVTEQATHFPLLNKIGQQNLVYQKMRNERYRTGQYLSEAQSGREVEAEIVEIVHRCAPLLGYTKSHVEPRREEKVSVGTPNMTIAEPLEQSYEDDDKDLDDIVQEYEKNLR